MAKLRYPEQVGTNQSDRLTSNGQQINFGLNGDDTLIASSYSDYNFLVGGAGNDTYVADGYDSVLTIIDSGGEDTVVADGIGAYSDGTYAATVDGKHLIAANVYTGQQVAITNWKSEGAVENFQLSDGFFTRAQIEEFMEASPNYLGDVSTSQLVEEGVLPPGTTDADLNEFMAYVLGSEQVLAQRADAAPPAVPSVEVEGLDDEFYLANNPDVAAAGVDPDVHFATDGWQQGRDPNSWFDTSFYLAKNPDVKSAGINPLTHYMEYGWKEGRDPSVEFDTDFYLSENPDVANAGINPAKHFEEYGLEEGRDPNAWFDVDWYLSQNPDVAQAGIDPVDHYWDWGWKEGRDPSAEFDTDAYLEANPDVALVGINPLGHWLEYGQAEGRELG
ncbi:hypothetical protein MHM84_01160 [Halomonas sp. McH1-25]|uniref:hypothetical protein n=1 Tax=unclassified Halomonas TaxID=2609666 RepID=UPI001EF47A1C|nr:MULTISPECIES: hypothetical protein [unclassified Halomonas]MCG7598390.1 hypothetical protein [Halomonas sp. McH1-25]MCP1342668.1 hypothetical protein [Halomonas sp. FL8]MCP1362564.1 hypothetical protein [Halomonas sp. BBD45]MCP1363730.1 hypothetical protein [Halomonas sp. BBD48]